jgi:CBS domain-containing protein
MSTCPFCDYENIEGTDLCAECEQPLLDTSRTTAQTEIERGLIKDRMTDLEPKTPTTVAPETPVGEILKLMVDQSIGCVLVVEEEKIVGIFTERDALYKLNTSFHRFKDQPVSEFMTKEPQTLDLQAKVVFALQRMDLGGFRHIPIVDAEGHATGIISVRDILRYLTDKLGKLEV